MHLAILANNKASFVKPLAEGLARMIEACGASCDVHYDGLEMLSLPLAADWSSPRSVARHLVSSRSRQQQFADFVERLRGVDVIVVVAHVPSSLARGSMPNVERLRSLFPKVPIVNYDLIYLPTVAKWSGAMLRGEETGLTQADRQAFRDGSFGMDRYDWYLTVSPVSEIPMPRDSQPLSVIGVNLNDGSLEPEQNGEFVVLVDFEQTRKDYLDYRKIQLDALKQSGVRYQVLDRPMTREEIRAVYRKTGAFLMAHRESFGLPLCELQACGSLIFTPHSEWAGAHWIKPDLTVAGPGTHSRNFILYENDVASLASRLQTAGAEFNPTAVREEFLRTQPHLFHGDAAVLKQFLTAVADGAINSTTHEDHAHIGR